MLRGLYTAASGMLVQTAKTDMLSNNLANVDTAGFQRQTPHVYSFPEMLISRVHNGTSTPVGTLGTGAVVDGDRSSFMPGAIKNTSNPLDTALVGPGFFAIETPDGPRYTRDGRFVINPSGFLVTHDGNRVRGENGPIVISGEQVVIDDSGQVFVDGQYVDKLLIVEFNEREGLLRRGANLYEATPEAGQPFRYTDTTVVQGAVEMSNVN